MALKVKTVPEHMVNARPRFGLEGDKVFDYETSQYLPAQGEHVSAEGFVYDLAVVAQLIRENKFLETAVVGYKEPEKKEQPEQAQSDQGEQGQGEQPTGQGEGEQGEGKKPDETPPQDPPAADTTKPAADKGGASFGKPAEKPKA